MPLMSSCIDKFVLHLDHVIDNNKGRLDSVKQAMTGFAIDVIASTAFATVTNANAEGEKNPFVFHGLRFLQTPPLKLVAALAFPRFLNNLLGIRFFFNDESALFFLDIAKKLIKERKEKGGEGRKDLLQLLINASVDEIELEQSYDKLTVNIDEDDEEQGEFGTN